MPNSATAGNKGTHVRSDCFVTIELTNSGGLSITIDSKVKTLYGQQINHLCQEELKCFGVENANVHIDDQGALDFVIAARIEACVKKLINTDKAYLLDPIEACRYTSSKDRTRFSRLYLPGNTPKSMINAGIYKAHGIILDLEDSVALAKKDEARILVRNALRQVNFYSAERMVRINQLPLGFDDLAYIVPNNVHVILLPKCETVEHIQQVNQKIEDIKQRMKISQEVSLIPILENALGVENAFAIALAADNIAALAIGLEDYTADIGAERSFGAKESFYARSKLVNACSAALIQPMDSVFSDIDDLEGLQKYALTSKQLGFAGMGCIHPRQIDVVNACFAPSQREIEDARKIINAFSEAEEKGLAAVSLGSKMIDPPVVKRAQKVVDSAIVLGRLSPDWRIGNG